VKKSRPLYLLLAMLVVIIIYFSNDRKRPVQHSRQDSSILTKQTIEKNLQTPTRFKKHH
jgi:hypothetical protein